MNRTDPLVYLGDEVSAAGWRLVGLRTVVPAAGRETAALADACDGTRLVLLSAAVAARIEPETLRRARAAPAPLLLVLPDPQGEVAAPDLIGRLRTQLGLDAATSEAAR